MSERTTQLAAAITQDIADIEQAAESMTRTLEQLTGSVEGAGEAGRSCALEVRELTDALEAASQVADDTAQFASQQMELCQDVASRLERIDGDTRAAIQGSANNMEVGRRLMKASAALRSDLGE